MLAQPDVQLAQPADAAQIAELSRVHIEYGLPWGWTPARVMRSIRHPASNVAVVREETRVVGFGIMRYTDEDAHLLLLAVQPDRRRRGIASAIVNWLEDVARAAGARRVRVESRRQNEAARCLYNEHGYHERAIRGGMYAGSVDGVLLEKWLRTDEGSTA
jgi:[ribosomal protein S18]-alanine N-acetyltransferase